MIISNPITPRTTELRQSILYARWQINHIKEKRDTAPQALYNVLNESLVFWLDKISKYEEELKQIEKYQEELK